MDTSLTKFRRKCPALVDLSSSFKKSSNTLRKDLICTVCGSTATGFNFGVITCMCCKAFFRRNALPGLSALQCRYVNEDCSINLKTRRDCSFCRLKKCFLVGMKKELILSEELKQMKREKILANRRQTLNSIHAIDSLHIKHSFQLKESDLSFLTNIYNAFEDYCRLPTINFEKSEYFKVAHQPLKSRVKLSNYIDHYEKSRTFLINFLERLPEFKQLDLVEQKSLVERNSRSLIRITILETLNEFSSPWPALNLLLETIFGREILNRFNHILRIFRDQINDSICIRLFLIISLFSMNNFFNDTINTVKIYRIQEKYTEILWCYLRQRYTEQVACEYISITVRHMLSLQVIGHLADMRRIETFRENSFLS